MMELTNRQIKIVKSLSEARTRREENAFKAEGTKCVLDTLGHFNLRMLITTAEWAAEHPEAVRAAGSSRHMLLPAREMSRISSLKTPGGVVAVYDIPDPTEPDLGSELVVALDSIQDPGNMGTIIRTCDWFGVRRILCTPSTVDIYSPKVVQSTMGAISRVKVTVCDLERIIANTDLPVYGTFLDGTDIYSGELTPGGIVVMGNEGNGISPQLEKAITRRLFIPPYPAGAETSESLNVGIATAIVLSQFRSRIQR